MKGNNMPFGQSYFVKKVTKGIVTEAWVAMGDKREDAEQVGELLGNFLGLCSAIGSADGPGAKAIIAKKFTP